MKILIAEDEEGIANFLKQGLEEEGYEVDLTGNGQTAFEMAQAGSYQLILLDWMMPGMSGLDVCRGLRKKLQDTPIIFLTAKDTVEETVQGLKAGANDYIRKPFHFEELLERIRVQFRPSVSDDSEFRLGDIMLSTSRHEVKRNDEKVNLTQKEFALLEFLMRNKGRVCRRTEIIEKVWNIHFDYQTGVIDVYINALRKKLMLTEQENYIQTVRGIGYMAQEQ